MKDAIFDDFEYGVDIFNILPLFLQKEPFLLEKNISQRNPNRYHFLNDTPSIIEKILLLFLIYIKQVINE